MFYIDDDDYWDIISENLTNLECLYTDNNPLDNEYYDEDLEYGIFQTSCILRLEKLKVLSIRSEHLYNKHFLDNLKKLKNLKTIYIINSNDKKFNYEDLKKEFININFLYLN